jgi:hypothetical protein
MAPGTIPEIPMKSLIRLESQEFKVSEFNRISDITIENWIKR